MSFKEMRIVSGEAEQMKRLVDTVESAARAFVTIYSDGQQRAQDFKEKNAKDAIASAEKSARLESRKMRHAVIGLAMSIVVAATGFIGSGINEKTKYERGVEAAEFQRRLTKLDEISVALTEVRRVKEDAALDCGTPGFSPQSVAHKRVEARYELMKKCRNADFYFGEDVYSEARKFIDWEMSFPDYCAKNLPDPEEWKRRQKKIETMIRSTIRNPLTD